MTKNLTVGSPMRLIVGFALPTLFGMLFQQFYNLVDTMIVGKLLGAQALAAVGSTGSINFLVIGFCTGVCSGFSIPVAQKFGQRDVILFGIFFGTGVNPISPARDYFGDILRQVFLHILYHKSS